MRVHFVQLLVLYSTICADVKKHIFLFDFLLKIKQIFKEINKGIYWMEYWNVFDYLCVCMNAFAVSVIINSLYSVNVFK